MLVKVPELDAQQATIPTIDVGQVVIGPIAVADLVVTNTDFAVNAGHGVAKNMDLHVNLGLALEWRIRIKINKIINKTWSSTSSLGSVDLHMPPLDVALPALNNIHLSIPNLVAQNVAVQADPVHLQLQNAAADQIQAKNVTLPALGFTLAGLSLTSIEGDTVAVPAARLDQATVNHLRGDPVSVSSFALHDLQLGSAQAASIVNTSPLQIPADLTLSKPPGFDAGLLRVVLHITAKARAFIPYLELNDVNASATVGRVELHNVRLPYDVLNLTLSQVGINSISIPAFAVS